MTDFPGLAASLLTHSRAILAEWLPNGRWEGAEYCVGNLSGAPGSSLKINADTGVWKDFADDSTGGRDLCSLYAAIHGISQGEAAKRLSNGSAPIAVSKPAKKPNAIIPVPLDAPPPPAHLSIRSADKSTWDQHPVTGLWWYHNVVGQRIGCILRIDPPKGKELRPYVWTSEGWKSQAFDKPRPLYGLELIASHVAKPIMIVEGEKAADAARNLCPQYTVITWIGGSSAWSMCDWSSIQGRQILLWPDADDPGEKCMLAIGHHLLKSNPVVKLILPTDVIPKFDAADAVADGWTWETFKAWAVPRMRVLTDEGEKNEQTNNGAIDRLDSSGRRGRENQEAVGGSPRATTKRDLADADTDGEHTEAAPLRASNPNLPLARDASPIPHGPPASLAGLSHLAIWTALNLDYSQNGPVANLDNVLRCLTGDSAWHQRVWFDEFLQRILTGDPPREWSDTDDTQLQAYLQRVIGIKKVSRETVTHAVILVAHQHRRNQVKEYIRSTQWDRINRCAGFFTRTLGAPDTDYTRAASQNFWVSMIARVERPGCKVDNMVILEGGQGMGKSTVANLIGGRWFAEQHESATNPKAFAENLAGVLLTEISEMDAFSRAEVNRVKQVVSCRSDRFRVAYGRHAEDHPRQGVFFGTTNKDDWNRDETGARRFWPIRCEGKADTKYVETFRDQLFAEALHLFQEGINWWDMPEEETKQQQAARYAEDAWQPYIDEYLSQRDSTSVRAILIDCLDIEAGKQDTSASKRVLACLKFLGWKSGRQERVRSDLANVADSNFLRRWFRPGKDRTNTDQKEALTEREINAQLALASDTTDTTDTN